MMEHAPLSLHVPYIVQNVSIQTHPFIAVWAVFSLFRERQGGVLRAASSAIQLRGIALGSSAPPGRGSCARGRPPSRIDSAIGRDFQRPDLQCVVQVRVRVLHARVSQIIGVGPGSTDTGF